MSPKFLIVLAAVQLALSACSAAPSAQPAAPLEGVTWTLAQFGAHELGALRNDQPVTLTFSAGRVEGQAPCNKVSGSYTFERGTLTIDTLSRSKMFCEDTSQLEELFLAALQTAHQIRPAAQQLLLEGGQQPLRFTGQTPD